MPDPRAPEHAPREILRKPQSRPGQVALALAVALLGFLLATQFRARQTEAGRLKTEREADLAQLLADLQKRSDALIEQVVTLQVRLSNATGSQDKQRVLVSDATLQLRNLRLLLGLVPAKGEGIEMTIADPQNSIPADILVDVLQELRDAGADAIEINGRRVVAQTAFTGRPGAIQMDHAALVPPYLVRAIGARSTLSEAMRIPGGVVDAVQAQTGASITIVEQDVIQITALHAAPRFSYATRP